METTSRTAYDAHQAFSVILSGPVPAQNNVPQTQIPMFWLLFRFAVATLDLAQSKYQISTILHAFPVLRDHTDWVQIPISIARLAWRGTTIKDSCRQLVTFALLVKALFYRGATTNRPVCVTVASFA